MSSVSSTVGRWRRWWWPCPSQEHKHASKDILYFARESPLVLRKKKKGMSRAVDYNGKVQPSPSPPPRGWPPFFFLSQTNQIFALKVTASVGRLLRHRETDTGGGACGAVRCENAGRMNKKKNEYHRRASCSPILSSRSKSHPRPSAPCSTVYRMQPRNRRKSRAPIWLLESKP